MDSIAIISDIHGNLSALQTVLADIKKRNIQQIYCLGDIIAKGSNQQMCVDLIRSHCQVILQGNCESFFSNTTMIQHSSIESSRTAWVQSKLNQESLNYLQTLPFSHEFYLSGRLVRLLHAHPDRNDKLVGNIDLPTNQLQLFMPSDLTVSNQKADIAVYGHIHTPFMQKMFNRILINVGSVGNALDIFRDETIDGDCLNTTVANYCILNGVLNSKDFNHPLSYEFIALPYDIDQELTTNIDNIELEAYQQEIKYGKYRDMKKVNKYMKLFKLLAKK